VNEAATPNPSIRVFLIAGCRVYREALFKALSSKRDLCVVGCASSFAQAAGPIQASDPGILLVSPTNGESCDLSLLETITRAFPAAKSILIDMSDDDGLFLRAVSLGVQGYLLRQASAMDIVAAVRSVCRGEAVCPPRLCRTLFQQVASGAGVSRSRQKTRAHLTRREQQMVPLIGRGLTNKEISCQLNISERTVKSHVHRLLRRVGAGDRLSAFEIVRNRNLATLFTCPTPVPLTPQLVSGYPGILET
jgi:two-component system response regulator DevR